MGSISDAVAVSDIFVHTNMAAAAGVVTVLILSTLLLGKINLPMVLNGAIGGLVSITAEPLIPAPLLGTPILTAVIVGSVGGVIVFLTMPLLESLKIDDVVGAIPAHLFCGIWGTLIVPFSNTDISIGAQATGVAANAIFVFGTSLVLWFLLRFTIGIRSSEAEEEIGLDLAETGAPGYDFVPVNVPAE